MVSLEQRCRALSTADAAGLWQFVPGTGKDFNLKQNMFKDERRGVLASTDAALTYLQRLYTMFGDWQLALAAYNAGPAAVLKHGGIPPFRETKAYVGKVLAELARERASQ